MPFPWSRRMTGFLPQLRAGLNRTCDTYGLVSKLAVPPKQGYTRIVVSSVLSLQCSLACVDQSERNATSSETDLLLLISSSRPTPSSRRISTPRRRGHSPSLPRGYLRLAEAGYDPCPAFPQTPSSSGTQTVSARCGPCQPACLRDTPHRPPASPADFAAAAPFRLADAAALIKPGELFIVVLAQPLPAVRPNDGRRGRHARRVRIGGSAEGLYGGRVRAMRQRASRGGAREPVLVGLQR
ncbi:hypothetical protein DFH06DRAFT_1252580 [Mycena polygramma]|nr:hypothetical protein DFH06DRAFT_1252580 [Mycena polygramma]